MSNIFNDDDIPEIQPLEAEGSVEGVDELAQPVSKKFAFVGCGAAGGRIVDEFYKKGYRRAMVANTCSQDRQGLSPDLEFIDLSLGGSGKDPSVSRACVALPANRVQFLRFFEEILGTDFQYIMVCAGLGGGTGSGMGPEMIKYLKEYIASKNIKAKIGCILSLPMASEGSRVAKNAVYAYADFLALEPSPVIIIDNARVAKLRKSSFARLYPDANSDAVNLLHALNTLSAMPALQTFDGSDFSQLLDSGMITFGRAKVSNWTSGSDIVAKTIMETFQSATLADVDVSQATQGVCIIVAGHNVLDTFSTDELMSGLDLLRNSSQHKDMLLHPAVYENTENPDSLAVYVALGGLKPNKGVLEQLAKVGNVDMQKEEKQLPSGVVINSALAKFFKFE